MSKKAVPKSKMRRTVWKLRVEARNITIVAIGTTIREAYLTENWKVLRQISWSFFGSSLAECRK